MSTCSKQLVLRLEFGGVCIKECAAADLPSETRIGRAPDCFWRIPDSDRSASAHHALIRRKGRKVVVVDTDSRNGVYFKGLAVKERKIKDGDIFGIGDAKLVAELIASGGGVAAQFHTLEQLTGEDKGRTISLDHPVTRVGSGKECEIRIADSLVSHVHALFEVRSDGYCYVKDNVSRNGIKINGVRQNEEAALTGQMLKDGDIVSVAYVDFRFWDRNVQHVRANLAQKILVVGATLAISLGGYFGVQTFYPSAKTLRLRAERIAASGRFEDAAKLTKESGDARGAELDVVQRGELLRKISLWSQTAKAWNEIKDELTKEADVDLWTVNRRFAALISSDDENWKWNTTDAIIEMVRAKATQTMLAKYLSGVERLGKSDGDRDALVALATDAEKELSSMSDVQPYQAVIRKQLADLAEELRRVVSEMDAIRQTMDEYTDIEKTDQVVDAIDKIAQETIHRNKERKGAGKPIGVKVERICAALSVPLAELQKSLRRLESNYRAVADASFADFESVLPVPSMDTCMVEANLTTRRAELLTENELLSKAIMQLRSFRLYLGEEKILAVDKSTPPAFSLLFDIAVRSRALDCDCFTKPPPSYSSKSPTSSYDGLLGVNVFYPYLSSIDGDFDSSVFEERFTPGLFKAVAAFKTLDQFVSFCNPSGNTPYASIMRKIFSSKAEKRVLEKEVAIIKSLLERRDEIVREMEGIAEREKGTRKGVLASGMAFCMREGRRSATEEGKVSASIVTDFKNVRRRVNEVLRSAEGKGPETRISVERAALQLGIPGDPLLRQPWADQTRGGLK